MAIKIINFPDGFSSASTPPVSGIIGPDDVDGSMILLNNNEALRGKKGPTGNQNIIKVNASDEVELSSAGVRAIYANTPTALNEITNKSFVDTSSASAVSTANAYTDTQISNLINAAPGVLDTLDELAQALGDDPNFATTTATALGNRLRVDTAAQGLTGAEKTNAKTNIDLNNVPNVDATNPANISQTSSYRFVTDTEKTTWNAVSMQTDTYSNLVTFAATASDGKLCYASDLDLLYYVSNGILQEFAVMKTINGTISTAQVTVGTSQVRATVSGSAPNANRKRLKIKPNKNNTGAIFYGGTGLTTSTGMEIIGPDGIILDYDASDYYLISDTLAQTVEILEVI